MNTTEDTNVPDNNENLQFAATDVIVAYTIVYGLIFIISLAGNFIVCFVILRNRDMRTVTNAFLVNLAIADILNTLLAVPVLYVLEIVQGYWLFGSFVCRALPFFQNVATVASIYTMVVLACDRYNAIVHPLKTRVVHTSKRAVIIITSLWVFSFILSFPIAVTYSFIEPTYCSEIWDNFGGLQGDRAYTLSLFFLVFVIPVIIIIIAYTKIIIHLNQPNRVFAETLAQSNHNMSVADGKRAVKKKRKITLMLMIVTIAFLICNLPFQILSIVHRYLPEDISSSETLQKTNSILVVLVLLPLNPFIYNFFSEKFNKAFVKVFKCRCRDNRVDSVADMNSMAFLRGVSTPYS